MLNKKWLLDARLYILIFGIVLTLINSNKAFHIDDAFHLEAAQTIQEHPLSPMSGKVNWSDFPKPLHHENQPPLFFYLVLLFQSVFGNSEIGLHLLIAIFTFVNLVYFYKIGNEIGVKKPILLLTLFAFNPAFIVNQNLMTDVPVMALVLMSVYYLIKGLNSKNWRFIALASLVLGFTLLIKYTVLPLFVVLVIATIRSKNIKNILTAIIPIVMLALWSFWNISEFGSSHLFGRSASMFEYDKIISFIAVFGAIFTPSFILVQGFFKRSLSVAFLSLVFVFALLAIFVYAGIIQEDIFAKGINIAFFINGLVSLGVFVFFCSKRLISNNLFQIKLSEFVMGLYILGMTLFLVLFTPFAATRHILLILPFAILLMYSLFAKADQILKVSLVSVTIIFGFLMSVSDWFYADFYRKSAKNIASSYNIENKIWSLGHWGWQHYSRLNGMEIYSSKDELRVRNGDLIVVPSDVPKQFLNPEIKLNLIGQEIDQPSILTFFSGKNHASFYHSNYQNPTWALSNIPIDTISVYEVVDELDVDYLVNKIKSNKEQMELIQKKANERGVSTDSMLVLDANWLLNQARN